MPSLDESLRVLGIDSAASEADLRLAYRRLIIQWHPDKHHSDPQLENKATEVTKRLNAAFEHLSELHEQGMLPTARTTPHPKATASVPHPTSTRSTDQPVRHQYRGATFRPGFPDPSVFEVFVKSSNIVSAGYNRAKRVLFLKFVGGAVYQYFDVPPEVFEAFLNAPSHGKFAHAVIYRRFRYEACR